MRGADHDLLKDARIGALALAGPHYPLVNPAAFHQGGGALWMTTSRRAAKLSLARRDPRAAFLVVAGGRAVLVQGWVERFDPLSLGAPLRILLEPAMGLHLAGYALKNAPYVSGYLLDLPRVPGAWWPHNRVVLRMRVEQRRAVPTPEPQRGAPQRPVGPPAEVARAISRTGAGAACWTVGRHPVLAPALWAWEGGRALAWLPPGGPPPPGEAAPGALAIDRHHSFRASRMLGVCLRGRWRLDPGGAAGVAERFGCELPEAGTALELDARRVTWWHGFEVQSLPAVRPVSRLDAG